MKTFSVLTLSAILIAVILTTVCYFVLDGELPGAGGITLIVIVSLVIAEVGRRIWQRRSRPSGHGDISGAALMILALGATALVSACSSSQRAPAVVAVVPPPSPPPPPPPPPLHGERPTYAAPPPSRPPRILDTGRAFLYGAEREDSVYGLFSYLLFTSPPASRVQRSRYVAAIEAFLRTPAANEMVAGGFDKPSLNIFYLPLTKAVPDNVDSILKYYNYVRARRIMLHLRIDRPRGVYLASALVPLTYATSETRLVQRLTKAYPTLVDEWVSQFCEHATRERFWELDKRADFVMNLRNAIAVAGGVTPQVRDSLKDLIDWVKD